MPGTDLALLIDAALEAGRIATGFSGKQARRWDKPDGAGPVTEADLAVNAMLEDRLRSARPDYGWLSEESEDGPDRLDRPNVFITDPIDGTRGFAEGAKTWAHALAISQDAEITQAVIYLPLREMLFHAEKGQGAFLNGNPISAGPERDLAEADILAAKPNLEPRFWKDGKAPGFHRSYRPSLAYRMATVAQGRFDGMLTLRPSWEWDIAAGDLILREAGAICTDRTGKKLRFNNPSPLQDGVIAGTAGIHEQIASALNEHTIRQAWPA